HEPRPPAQREDARRQPALRVVADGDHAVGEGPPARDRDGDAVARTGLAQLEERAGAEARAVHVARDQDGTGPRAWGGAVLPPGRPLDRGRHAENAVPDVD